MASKAQHMALKMLQRLRLIEHNYLELLLQVNAPVLNSIPTHRHGRL